MQRKIALHAAPLLCINTEDGGEKGQGEKDDSEDGEDHDGAGLVSRDFRVHPRQLRFLDVGLLLLHIEELLEGLLRRFRRVQHAVDLLLIIFDMMLYLVQEQNTIMAFVFAG